MNNTNENEPADVVEVAYEPLPPLYEPYNPTNKQKRALERLIKKKRS